ncbi:30S ribosomal protein S3, partial [Escherichia coli]
MCRERRSRRDRGGATGTVAAGLGFQTSDRSGSPKPRQRGRRRLGGGAGGGRGGGGGGTGGGGGAGGGGGGGPPGGER